MRSHKKKEMKKELKKTNHEQNKIKFYRIMLKHNLTRNKKKNHPVHLELANKSDTNFVFLLAEKYFWHSIVLIAKR